MAASQTEGAQTEVCQTQQMCVQTGVHTQFADPMMPVLITHPAFRKPIQSLFQQDTNSSAQDVWGISPSPTTSHHSCVRELLTTHS